MRRSGAVLACWSSFALSCGGNPTSASDAGGAAGSAGTLGDAKASGPECADVPNGIPSGGPPDVTELASGFGRPFAIAADADFVFWLELDDQPSYRVKKAPVNGGVPVALASGMSNPVQLALDADRVYWADPGYGTLGIGASISSADKAGGTPLVLHSAPGFEPMSELVVDDVYVYWSTYFDIRRTLKDGTGTADDLATGQEGAQGLALDDAYLYWANYSSGEIARMPKIGGTVEKLVTGLIQPRHVALSCGRLYFNLGSGGTLWSWDPTTLQPTLVSSEFADGAFPVDSRYAYTARAAKLSRIRFADGNVETLDSTEMSGRRIALNDVLVFWFSEDTGSKIWAAHK